MGKKNIRTKKLIIVDKWSDKVGRLGRSEGASLQFTFSLGPEDEGPQEGDHLKFVVTQFSHLLDCAGQDHPF